MSMRTTPTYSGANNRQKGFVQVALERFELDFQPERGLCHIGFRGVIGAREDGGQDGTEAFGLRRGKAKAFEFLNDGVCIKRDRWHGDNLRSD